MRTRIALAGNPNTGKTTLFNALTGASQYVGNWPGVTVEKKEGTLKGHRDVTVTDLPGIYSLSPYTLEEVVARDYLIQERPDVVLNIIDGTNLERNLYLTTQLLELGIPVVAAVNMMDVVRRNGDRLDTEKLRQALGCEVVEISAIKGEGIGAAAERALSAAGRQAAAPIHRFSGAVEHALTQIGGLACLPEAQQRWYAIKLFERDEKVIEQLKLPPDLISRIEADIQSCEEDLDDDAESIITAGRYDWISSIMGSCFTRKHQGRLSVSDRIDQVVTNRILALPIFIAAMGLVYALSMGSWPVSIGTMATDWANDVLFGTWVPGLFDAVLTGVGVAEGSWLYSLILDGIVAGVGAVLGFVPQMLVLFLLLCVLEDIGYMARIAFIMDRVFRRFGLSGKSFIPMLVATGCGVPGIMASRTIEQERDRRMTIMPTGFMPPFVMELPAYHAPHPGNVLRGAWERGWSFIKRAGTVILLSSIVLWFLQGYGLVDGVFQAVEDNNDSLLASIGSAAAWIFYPLGWKGDMAWKATVASVTGLIAKENVVDTFGVLYHYAGDVELIEDSSPLWALVTADFTAMTAYSFMIFNLLCAPCFAAMGAIKREMNSVRWTAGAIGYMCAFAYIAAMIVYQLGGLLTGEAPFSVFTVLASALLAGLLFLLFRPDQKSRGPVRLAGRSAARA